MLVYAGMPVNDSPVRIKTGNSLIYLYIVCLEGEN